MKYHCERCGKKLKDRTSAIWMELDTRTDTYTVGDVPEGVSLGAFPFGESCAKHAQAEHDEKALERNRQD